MSLTPRVCEGREHLQNEWIRLDFDRRTSDTMYNYVWVRRPDTGEWVRLHNFGVDVRTPSGADSAILNMIGMDLDLARDATRIEVTYPNPMVRYRQFEKAQTLADVNNYPDITRSQAAGLVHADASVRFVYELDAGRPSFVVSGRVLQGEVTNVVYIIDALWTDNHVLPTHFAGQTYPEYAIDEPDAEQKQRTYIEDMAYVFFYRRDGRGCPFVFLPLRPDRSLVYNLFNNSRCLRDVRVASTNQAFIPEDPPVTGCNDTGYVAEPDPDGALRGVRVVFLPELGWGQGGRGDGLRIAIEERIDAQWRSSYFKR